jgi:hypothetical protein
MDVDAETSTAIATVTHPPGHQRSWPTFDSRSFSFSLFDPPRGAARSHRSDGLITDTMRTGPSELPRGRFAFRIFPISKEDRSFKEPSVFPCPHGSLQPRVHLAHRTRPHRHHHRCATGADHPAMEPTPASATPPEYPRPRSRSGRAREHARRRYETAAPHGGERCNQVDLDARTSRAGWARDVRACAWRCRGNASDHGSQVMIPSSVVAAAWLPKPA